MAIVSATKIMNKDRKNGYGSHLVFQSVFQSLKPNIKQDGDIFAKNVYAGHGNGSKKDATNRSRVTNIER